LARTISVRPISIKVANEFVGDFHRHHRPTVRNNGKWALAALDVSGEVVGVVIASSPVSATYMDGLTIELTRLCVKPGAPKGVCSFLLSKCCAIWRSMGGARVITYTLESESGASLRGAGWVLSGVVKPHKRWQNKSKVDGVERAVLEIYELTKNRWVRLLDEVA
jgi:hypothetical protein